MSRFIRRKVVGAERMDSPPRVGVHGPTRWRWWPNGKQATPFTKDNGWAMGLMDVPDAIAKARARKGKENPGYGWVVANDRGEQVAGPFENEQDGWNYIKEKG
jgi:hypothetical protein